MVVHSYDMDLPFEGKNIRVFSVAPFPPFIPQLRREAPPQVEKILLSGSMPGLVVLTDRDTDEVIIAASECDSTFH